MKSLLEQLFDASHEAFDDYTNPTMLFVGRRVWDDLIPKTAQRGMVLEIVLPHGRVNVFPDRYCPDGDWHLVTEPSIVGRGFYRHGSIDPPPTVPNVALRDPYFAVEEWP